MAALTFRAQLQQQQQEAAPQQGTRSADTSIDTDIAAFIAEGHEPDDTPAEPVGTDDSLGDADPVADSEAEPATDEPSPDAYGETDSVAPAGQAPAGVDQAALTAAITSGDPVAFVKALGPAAEKLLTSKAHVALRLQVREAETAKATALGEQTRAKDLAKQLGEKYGDPITARKACEDGDVDTFIDMVEKWSDHSWNDVIKWVAGGIAGRKERLERKQRETGAQLADKSAKQEQKQAEVKAWVDGGVKKLAPELHSPEVVDMVVAEIRAGFNKGVTTPAKALPLVKAKLEAQYKRLHAVFGKPGSKAPSKTAANPSARAAHTDRAGEGQTRPTTLEEDIAWTKKLAGVK
jgi:hypothetical protein